MPRRTGTGKKQQTWSLVAIPQEAAEDPVSTGILASSPFAV